MKIISFLILLSYSAIFYCQEDSVKIEGRLFDSYSNLPIENYKVVLLKNYGSKVDSIKTDRHGKFNFHFATPDYYYLLFSDDGYIEKTYSSVDTNSIVNVSVKLRPQNRRYTYNDIDSTLIGKKMKTAFKNLSLDITDVNKIYEPPGILRGIDFELGDSTEVYLLTNRTPQRRFNRKEFMKLRIVGVCILKVDGSTNCYGEASPFVIRFENKYFINE